MGEDEKPCEWEKMQLAIFTFAYSFLNHCQYLLKSIWFRKNFQIIYNFGPCWMYDSMTPSAFFVWQRTDCRLCPCSVLNMLCYLSSLFLGCVSLGPFSGHSQPKHFIRHCPPSPSFIIKFPWSGLQGVADSYFFQCGWSCLDVVGKISLDFRSKYAILRIPQNYMGPILQNQNKTTIRKGHKSIFTS